RAAVPRPPAGPSLPRSRRRGRGRSPDTSPQRSASGRADIDLDVAAVELHDLSFIAEALLDATQQIGDAGDQRADDVAIAVYQMDHDRRPGAQHNLQDVTNFEIAGSGLRRGNRGLE